MSFTKGSLMRPSSKRQTLLKAKYVDTSSNSVEQMVTDIFEEVNPEIWVS